MKEDPETTYGLLSSFDTGICPDCLAKQFGPDWKVHVANYDDPKRPKDHNGNTYDWWLSEKHTDDVLCGLQDYQCSRVWNYLNKKWEIQK